MKLSFENKNGKEIFNIHRWRIFNILSLDVVTGSIAGGIMATTILNVKPGFAWWIVLPLSVWIVYTLDHLIDGMRLKKNAHTVRHLFHFHYSKPILTAIILFTLTDLFFIVFFLDKSILFFGIYAGAITLIYLAIVYFSGKRKILLLQKELFVALIYTIGIWGGPVALRSYVLNSGEILLTSMFFLVVWIAILILSIYEVDSDRIDKHNTVAVNFGTKKTSFLIFFLSAILFLTGIIEIISTSNIRLAMAFKILLIMDMILLLILSFPEKLKRENIYRTLVEMVFWLPGLFFYL